MAGCRSAVCQAASAVSDPEAERLGLHYRAPTPLSMAVMLVLAARSEGVA